ncbi:MFS transporter [Amycolatopsis viridis]|uniref:ACS family tartrate transporter-like MFS transporter n=1 Tax=Amycolatopsis viridis TaxID=185678 RepID=A0ABX0SUT8_9PSEU|nr:MFS transporter [Amycolatopsis viridis]NIH79101.1 ACS family tartrate transporter-like MFS transporter [Amycolatopsis viridis]
MTENLEAAVVRKVVWRFIPLLMAGEIVLKIDLNNISIGALTMNADLGLSAATYGLAAGIYFWAYCLLELPSNLILTKVGSRVWISRIMLLWGLITIASAFLIHSGTSLIVMRVVLGAAEAGYSPAAIYFISRWFPKAIRARMYGMFVASLAVSALFSPAMGYILKMDGVAGLAGWRWLFILTGIPAVVVSIACAVWLRNGPHQVKWLSPAERGWLQDTLDQERRQQDAVKKHSIGTALRDPRLLALCAVYFLIAFSYNGYSLWLPQVLHSLGLGNTAVGWFAALPALLAIGPLLWWLRHSDRSRERVVHFVIPALIAAAGLTVAGLSLAVPVLAIAGFCVSLFGILASLSVFWSLPTAYLTGGAAAAGIGLIHTVANSSGYFGPQLIGVIKSATGSFAGGVLVLGVASLIAAALVFVLGRHSALRDSLALEREHHATRTDAVPGRMPGGSPEHRKSELGGR